MLLAWEQGWGFSQQKREWVIGRQTNPDATLTVRFLPPR